jgi:hypothetical protein
MFSSSNLREGGVYLLPDGEKLIATADHRGGFFLYTPPVWDAFRGWGPAAYDVMPEGPIVTCGGGHDTLWRVDDLVDTGETRGGAVRYATPIKPRDDCFY